MVRAMETLVVALLCAVVALVGADTEPFPLSAELAWGLGTEQYESVRDRTQGWQKKDITECYTGNELYSQSTVFCDRECLETTDKKDHWRCQGPWYCAKTEVGQEFWDDMDSHGANWKRANVTIRGCANISQCFPGASARRRRDEARSVVGRGRDASARDRSSGGRPGPAAFGTLPSRASAPARPRRPAPQATPTSTRARTKNWRTA